MLHPGRRRECQPDGYRTRRARGRRHEPRPPGGGRYPVNPMIILFAGFIGRSLLGGTACCHIPYLRGLSALGHEVFYLEECGKESWVYNWETEEVTADLACPAAYLRECLDPVGFKDRWIYRAGEKSEGMRRDHFLDVCLRADLLIIYGVPMALWRPEYGWPRRRIYIDIDPGFTQISLMNGDPELTATVEQCERLFTIGQRIGEKDCAIPSGDRQWLKTVPPISLQDWPYVEDHGATHFTSVMQWRGFRDVVYGGVVYGQKDREFPMFLDLPRLTPQSFLIALTDGPAEYLAEHGWRVVPGWIPSRTTESYRAFIQSSRAEFSVAKHGYVLTRGGWFSDRSVCYLASGRPVLVEDTGLRDWLPTGQGIVTFRNVSEALRGIEAINADYERHRRAARLLAEEYFDAQRVLPPLLDAAMI